MLTPKSELLCMISTNLFICHNAMQGAEFDFCKCSSIPNDFMPCMYIIWIITPQNWIKPSQFMEIRRTLATIGKYWERVFGTLEAEWELLN